MDLKKHKNIVVDKNVKYFEKKANISVLIYVYFRPSPLCGSFSHHLLTYLFTYATQQSPS